MKHRKIAKKITAAALALMMAAAVPATTSEAAFNIKPSYYGARVLLSILSNVRAQQGDDYDFSDLGSNSTKIMDFVKSAALYDYQWSTYRTSKMKTSDRLRTFSVPYEDFEEIISSYFYTIPDNFRSDIEAAGYLDDSGNVNFSVNYGYEELTSEYKVTTLKVYDYGSSRYAYFFGGWYNNASPKASTTENVYLVFAGSSSKIWSILRNDPLPQNGTLMADEVTYFEDIEGSEWFVDSVGFAYNEGIMTGMSSYIFGPAENLSRAMFATMLYRMNGAGGASYIPRFPDVDDGMWYTLPIMWASEVGVVTGYEDGTFGPANNITREQLALMLYRYAKSKGFDVSLYSLFSPADEVTADNCLGDFPDGTTVSGFAKEAMAWAVNSGIITGKEENGVKNLAPQASASRAECATMLQRFCKIYGTTK